MRLGCSLLAFLLACGKLASEPGDASAPPPCTITTPQALAVTSTGMIGSFALHGASVLWETKDGIWSAPKDGGTAVNLAPCAPYGFAIDGETAFCFVAPYGPTTFQLLRVPLDGSGTTMLAAPAAGLAVNIIGAMGGQVYTYGGSSIVSIDELTAKVAPVISSAPAATLHAVGDGLLYWSSTVDATTAPVTTLNVTTTTGETTALATLSGFISTLAKNSSELFIVGAQYASNKLVEAIYRMPVSGGTPVPFISAVTAALAVDDSTLYAVSMNDGPRAFPLDGSPPVMTNVPASDTVLQMEIDDRFIYWLTMTGNGGGSALYRVCR